MTDSVSLIKRWLNRCVIGGTEYGPDKNRHDLCRWSMTRTIIEEKSETIPADRIIDVGEASSGSIRLVETAGLKAEYCALSHCWGPADKRPPCTTTENETAHFEGIDIATLPKTFREAVELTRGLGIKYLWIDSLCIRQDDKEHWYVANVIHRRSITLNFTNQATRKCANGRHLRKSLLAHSGNRCNPL